jgi:protein-disulfide isomerase
MATQESTKQSGLGILPRRSSFRLGKTRRQRQTQYTQQVNALLMVLLVAIVGGGLIAYFNYRTAGSTKTVSCEEFPEFCVPLVGGATMPGNFDTLESAESRTLDGEVTASAGVVRGINAINAPFLGNPDAPIHFVTVSDFACSHCQDYHSTDLPRFIDDYVLTGQATFGFVMTTGTGREYSDYASQAALCAGEQGAFWEMSEELFRLARSIGVQTAFSPGQIRQSADDMGLDGDALSECAASGRYATFLYDYRTFAQDNGVTGTPTVLVSYGNSGEWTAVNRDYNSLKALTEAANNG